MLSNQILHKTVQDIKRITGLECGVWDMDAKCLVMTSERMLGLEKEVALSAGRRLKSQNRRRTPPPGCSLYATKTSRPIYWR